MMNNDLTTLALTIAAETEEQILSSTYFAEVTRKPRVLLVNPRYPHWNFGLPLGLAMLGTVLRQHGIAAEIIDMNVRGVTVEDFHKHIQTTAWDWIGFTASTPQIDDAYVLLRSVKTLAPHAKTVFGGVHPTVMPDEILTHGADVVVRGEGELTFLQLLKWCALLPGIPEEYLQTIRGISFIQHERGMFHTEQRPRIQHLDRLPITDLDLLPFPEGYSFHMQKKGKMLIPISTSRGCTGHCIFCCSANTGVVARSPQSVMREITYYLNKYPTRELEFNFIDDFFTHDIERVEVLCSLLKRAHRSILWVAENTRADKATDALLRTMKEAGCYRISFGIESGSDHILRTMGKALTTQQIEKAVTMARNAGLEVYGLFIIGNYQETAEDIKKTIRFALRLPLTLARFSVCTPYPGTALHQILKREGKLLSYQWSDYGIYHAPLFNTDELTAHDIFRWYKRAYRAYYFNARTIVRMLQLVCQKENWHIIMNGVRFVLRQLFLRKANNTVVRYQTDSLHFKQRAYYTWGYRLPRYLSIPLFGDRKKYGLTIDPEDRCWKEWSKIMLQFHEYTHRGVLWRMIPASGYTILRHADFEGKKILEIGSGWEVQHSRYWNGKPSEYHVADINGAMLANCVSKLAAEGIRSVPHHLHGNGPCSLPFADASYDVIVLFYVLEHIHPLETYLEEILRVLRPGGMLVGGIPCEGGLLWGVGRFLTTRCWLKRNTTIIPDKMICWEHPNFADKVLRALDQRLIRQRSQFWPWGVPLGDINLINAFIYTKPLLQVSK